MGETLLQLWCRNVTHLAYRPKMHDYLREMNAEVLSVSWL